MYLHILLNPQEGANTVTQVYKKERVACKVT